MRHIKKITAVLLAALLLVTLISVSIISVALPLPISARTAAEAKSAALGFIAQSVGTPGFGDEWFVLAMARGGSRGPAYYNEYCARLESYVRSRGAVLSNTRSTENARVILALSAIGKDAASVGGYDLTAPFSNMDWVTNQGVNGAIYALLALDCGGYGTSQTRAALRDYILGSELSGGGWAASARQPASADYTAMALQALAPYRYDPRADSAVIRGLSVLSGMQLGDGSFGFEEEGSNTESTAQALIALTALGIDPAADARFAKAGGNALSAILSYQLPNGGFRHKADDSRADGMASEQAARALVAYDRFVSGEDFLYANLYQPHTHVFGAWTFRAIAGCTSPGQEGRACALCLIGEEVRTTPARGHDYIGTVTPPTKQAGGYTTHDCGRCGHSYTGDLTAKLPRTQGFSFWNWVQFIVLFGWIWME